MVHTQESAPRASRNQVLYLVDINRSATDVANKLVETYKKLGLNRNVIRMYCWSDEMNSSTVNLLETQKQELYHRITRQAQGDATEKKDGPLSKYDKEKDGSDEMSLRRLPMPILNPGCRSKSHYKDEKASRRAPTLEEAVTAFYEEHKDTTYSDIKNLARTNSTDLQDLRNHLVEKVYRDFLKVVDVIVTTPVTASKFASSLKVFDPKLVIFDEAPHARELSIMIPIAHFCPFAWIFTGDHRQVSSHV
jgi:regulator of nonsense transcripts 1